MDVRERVWMDGADKAMGNGRKERKAIGFECPLFLFAPPSLFSSLSLSPS